jgi:hypothetical protein
MSIPRAHEKFLQQLTVRRNKRHHQQDMHKRWAHQQHAVPLGIWCPGAAAAATARAAAAGSKAVVTCVTVAFMWALQMQVSDSQAVPGIGPMYPTNCVRRRACNTNSSHGRQSPAESFHTVL